MSDDIRANGKPSAADRAAAQRAAEERLRAIGEIEYQFPAACGCASRRSCAAGRSWTRSWQDFRRHQVSTK